MKINWPLVGWGSVWFSSLIAGVAGIVVFYNWMQSDSIFLVIGSIPVMLAGYFFLWVHFKVDKNVRDQAILYKDREIESMFPPPLKGPVKCSRCSAFMKRFERRWVCMKCGLVIND